MTVTPERFALLDNITLDKGSQAREKAAAAGYAAWAAARAARAAAWDAARDAARDALRPTVEILQASALELLGAMIDGAVAA